MEVLYNIKKTLQKRDGRKKIPVNGILFITLYWGGSGLSVPQEVSLPDQIFVTLTGLDKTSFPSPLYIYFPSFIPSVLFLVS